MLFRSRRAPSPREMIPRPCRLWGGAVLDQAPVSPTVEIRYRISLGDYLRVTAETGRRSWPAVALGTFILARASYAILTGDRGWTTWVLAALGIAIMAGLFGLPFAWLRVRQAGERLTRDVELSADSLSVRVRARGASSTFEWPTIRRVRETEDAVLLDYGTGVFGLIPKRAFDAAALAAFRHLAAMAGVRDMTPVWRPLLTGVLAGLLAMVVVTVIQR